MLDVVPTKIGQKWKNERSGYEGVSQRLNRFFISKYFAKDFSRYRYFVIPYYISNHFPICLELDRESPISHFPFNFNHMWIKDEDFSLLVRHFWNDIIILQKYNVMDRLCAKIKGLNKLVVMWERKNKLQS